MADGRKLLPMLIFKETNGNLPKKIKNAYDHRRIVPTANSKGWMNTTIMKEWIQEVRASNIRKDESYILAWDSFSTPQGFYFN